MLKLKTKLAAQWLRWLVLLLIPAVWMGADHAGWLENAENRTIDWRFQLRGEIPSPVKVLYVGIDGVSLQTIGGWPWNRSYFEAAAKAVLEKGGARAVGFDFVFSPLGQAEIADAEKIMEGDEIFRRYLFTLPPKPAPNVVVAGSYTAALFFGDDGSVSVRELPKHADEVRSAALLEGPEESKFQLPGGRTIVPPYIGLIDTVGGGTRTVPAWATSKTGDRRHMAVELVRLYLGIPIEGVKYTWIRPPTPRQLGLAEKIELVRDDGAVAATIPLREGQYIDVNWFLPWNSPRNLQESFLRVIAHAEALDPVPTNDPEQKKIDEADRKEAEAFFADDRWKNTIVLFGPTDPLLQDIAVTSLDETPVPRVSVHGNLVKTIVSGQYLTRLSDYSPRAVGGIVFALTILVSLFAAAGGTGGRLSKLTAILITIAYVWLCFALFGLPYTFIGIPMGPVENYHFILPMVAPIGSVFTTSFTVIIWALIDEEKQKGRIKGMFGTYLSPQLVSKMVESGEDPKLGGHEEEITAYFSDIQSFSSFSEKLPPARLVELMNEYLTACTDIVQAQGGTLDKYIGDAVVAMFGAPVPLPDHAFRACVASQLVHKELGALRAKWKEEGDKWPDIVKKMQSRIGLNSGNATIGNMGSRSRFNYTMMGDNVNLAARMESGAKSWGAYTMVADATRIGCQKFDNGRVIFRPLGRIVVMGRSQPVPIFEIVGLKESVPDSALECISIFEKALERYYAREWDAAIQLFKKSCDLEPNQPGKTPGVKLNPSLVYLNITEDYRAEPPAADWDGVYVMKEK